MRLLFGLSGMLTRTATRFPFCAFAFVCVWQSLNLTPLDVPFAWVQQYTRNSQIRAYHYYLDGKAGNTSRKESVFAYARRLRLPTLALLRDWVY